jgi:IMP dehydrogenase
MQFVDGQPPHFELTYGEAFIVPQYSDVESRYDTSIVPVDETGATLPIVVANMNAVAGRRMAETVARRGGLTIFSQDDSNEEVERRVRLVKDAHPMYETPIKLRPDETINTALSVIPKRAHEAALVVDGNNEPIGIFTPADAKNKDRFSKVSEIMQTQLDCMPEGLSTEEMFAWFVEKRRKYAPVVGKTGLIGVMTDRSVIRSSLYRPAVDAEGRLLVAAAVGINGDPGQRAKYLQLLGVDIIVVDTAHGHQAKAVRAIQGVREQVGDNMKIVAGNVVTPEGTLDLLAAGADIVKVGVGPGAMCTTRMQTGVGRPQFTAVLRSAEAAASEGKHIWADGGIKHPRDVALALAAGASSVMIGSLFAGTHESKADVELDPDGRAYKVNYGMASAAAVNRRNGGVSEYEQRRRALFAEGISTSRMYIDPAEPGVEDKIDSIVAGLRSAMTYSGARNLTEFHDKAIVGVQSAAGYEEGRPVHTSW